MADGEEPSIKLISFDLDGTLTDLGGFDRTFYDEEIPRLVALHRRIPIDEAKRIVYAEFAALGEHHLDYYFPDYWFSLFGIPYDPHRITKEMSHLVKVFADVNPTLAALKKDFMLIVLTNSPREFIQMKMAAEGIGRHFAHIISAVSDYRIIKKDKEIYHKMLERFGVKPEEVVHIGDHERFDYLGAKEAGIHAFHLVRDRSRQGDHVVHSMTEFAEKVHKLAGISRKHSGDAGKTT